MTIPELKSQLKEWKLPISGRKADLIERLTEHELNSQPTDSPQPSNDKKKSIAFPPPKDDTE
eukprot:scaffold31676_cov137-Skeletonema_menzelii.AAC.1